MWKNIDVDGIYQISDHGRVRRTTAKKRYLAGHVLSPWKSEYGYSLVRLTEKFGKKKLRVHRLVAEAFIPNPESKAFINHKNGVKTDNTVQNLEWTTMEENNDHNDTLIIHRFLESLMENKLYSKADLMATLPMG